MRASTAICAIVFSGSVQAAAQTFTEVPLPRTTIPRAQFMNSGYAASLALVADKNVDSDKKAGKSDHLIPVENGKCYRVFKDEVISGAGTVYFAINHHLPQPNFKNAFIAAQVLRLIRASNPNPGSDVAVWRSGDAWTKLQSTSNVDHVRTNWLGHTINEFVTSHTPNNNQFNVNAIDTFFNNTNEGPVEWHARLARISSAGKEQGYYSSLDFQLAPEWIGLANDFNLLNNPGPYRILMRSYLIPLSFTPTETHSPIIFDSDPVGSEQMLVRVSSSIGSGFDINRTFSLAFDQDCLFANR